MGLAVEYTSTVWDGCTKHIAWLSKGHRLLVVELVLRHSRRSTHNHKDLQLLQWPTLEWQLRRHKLLILWGLLHGIEPPRVLSQILMSDSARITHSLCVRPCGTDDKVCCEGVIC